MSIIRPIAARIQVRIASRFMTALASPGFQRLRQRRGRLQRQLTGGVPVLHYCHQVDDPYSHLAVQRLADLAARYRVRVVPLLAPPPGDAYKGDRERYPLWSLADARDVAPFYGVAAPALTAPPRPEAVARANRLILTDAAREGRACGQSLGRPVDPLGEPVRRALSLWSWADARGRGAEYLAEYLDAAWVHGVDVTTDAGLAAVLARAGLDWNDARPRLGGAESDAALDANLQSMLRAGLWGVPSYRVSGGAHPDAFSCWGQDRLWRMETEIARRSVPTDHVASNQ